MVRNEGRSRREKRITVRVGEIKMGEGRDTDSQRGKIVFLK